MRKKYQKLSSENIELIKRLTGEGKSLNYLSKLMKLGKTTIYYQVRKFKPRIKKSFEINLKDFQIGELLGAFAGDGNYFHEKYNPLYPKKNCSHRISYFLTFPREKDYADHIKKLLATLNLNPRIYIRNKNVMQVCVQSKEYILFIKNYLVWGNDKTYSIKLKKSISNYSEDFLKGFARGLMDTDGFLNPGNAVCACISEELINNLSEIFKKFGLDITRTKLERGGNMRPLYYVRVRRNSLENYRKFIGFSGICKSNYLNALLDRNNN